MKYIIAFAEFWIDFIVGDDWRIAVAVVVGLAVTAVLARMGVPEASLWLCRSGQKPRATSRQPHPTESRTPSRSSGNDI
jgi:hypothetical protein